MTKTRRSHLCSCLSVTPNGFQPLALTDGFDGMRRLEMQNTVSVVLLLSSLVLLEIKKGILALRSKDHHINPLFRIPNTLTCLERFHPFCLKTLRAHHAIVTLRETVEMQYPKSFHGVHRTRLARSSEHFETEYVAR